MANDAAGFLEYLQLQGESDPRLITKSELMTEVRARGHSISDRQLTFYVSEGLIPKSVRVGTRAGAYPRVVAELLSWILTSRDRGVPIEAIRQLLAVWKLLMRARRDHRLDLNELELVSRHHVTIHEGTMAVPMLVADVMSGGCPHCRGEVTIVLKDGREKSINDTETTIGFTFARRTHDEDGNESARWIGRTRMSLAYVPNFREDPTTVLLGIKPNERVPPVPEYSEHAQHNEPEANPDF